MLALSTALPLITQRRNNVCICSSLKPQQKLTVRYNAPTSKVCMCGVRGGMLLWCICRCWRRPSWLILLLCRCYSTGGKLRWCRSGARAHDAKQNTLANISSMRSRLPFLLPHYPRLTAFSAILCLPGECPGVRQRCELERYGRNTPVEGGSGLGSRFQVVSKRGTTK